MALSFLILLLFLWLTVSEEVSAVVHREVLIDGCVIRLAPGSDNGRRIRSMSEVNRFIIMTTFKASLHLG